MGSHTTRRRFLALGGSAVMGTISGCQDDGDTTGEETTAIEQPPDSTATETIVVSPETIKTWIDAGLVNSDPSTDAERVVIFRVGDIDSYEDGHLPGAFPWKPLHQRRLEALAPTAPMVPAGDVMDSLLQRSGVTETTTIVLSGSNPLFAARGYWTLRYWGFPRTRIKVLDAGYPLYGEAYSLESGGEPDSPTTDFSVRDTDGLNDDLRVSLGEMIHRVDSITGGQRDDVIIDQRSYAVATIASATVVPSSSYHEGSHFDSVAAWRSADELESILFEDADIPDGGPFITYGNTGYQGAMGFFALDGVLNLDDIALYDGSFESQWKHYDVKADPVPNDAWRVDIEGRTEGHTGESNLAVDPELNDALTSVTSEDANQIERADSAYMRGKPETVTAA
ncbi:MAG: selenite/tellurite reduction operon rhodanese-like protein ExtH [Haloarculaceae archaeon]